MIDQNNSAVKEVILKVPDSKFSFFMELINNLGFKVKRISSEEEVLKGIEQGLKEAKLIQKKKLKSRSAKDFLNEL